MATRTVTLDDARITLKQQNPKMSESEIIMRAAKAAGDKEDQARSDRSVAATKATAEAAVRASTETPVIPGPAVSLGSESSSTAYIEAKLEAFKVAMENVFRTAGCEVHSFLVKNPATGERQLETSMNSQERDLSGETKTVSSTLSTTIKNPGETSEVTEVTIRPTLFPEPTATAEKPQEVVSQLMERRNYGALYVRQAERQVNALSQIQDIRISITLDTSPANSVHMFAAGLTLGSAVMRILGGNPPSFILPIMKHLEEAAENPNTPWVKNSAGRWEEATSTLSR